MAGRFVRNSSYRHVFGSPAKPEETYQNIRSTKAGDANSISVNAKYIACAAVGGGGPLYVLDRKAHAGRMTDLAKLVVHKAAVTDVEFSPFNDQIVATCADDLMVKVSQIPEAPLTEDLTTSLATLGGHEKKCVNVHWHPTANNVLASAAQDATVRLWDVEAQAEKSQLSFGDNPWAFEWNDDGSRITCSTKDKKIHLVDPRDQKSEQTVDGFAGSKFQRSLFADRFHFIVGVGVGKTSTRQYGIWDQRKFDVPLSLQDLDSSAGMLMAHYDSDNSVLYLAGSGDSSIKYWELVAEAPYLHFLSEFRNSDSTVSVAWAPKRSLDVHKCEIALCVRVLKDTLVPISFQVPRKSDIFQKDLYPDAYAGVPTIEAADYFAGKNGEAKRTPMKPGDQVERVAHAVVVQKSAADWQKEVDALKAEVEALKLQLAAKA